MPDPFYAEALDRYQESNRAALRWMLDRPPLHGAFLNTKMNSITLRDYTEADGWRGPDFTYGWIQGRGLEALTGFAEAFSQQDPELAIALHGRARLLYAALDTLTSTDGHCYFCYDRLMRAVHPDLSGARVMQAATRDIFTYSDAFAGKGLALASALFAPDTTQRHLAHLARTIEAIDNGQFQMDERIALGDDALDAQVSDLGPRMILLGAAPLMAKLGGASVAAYAGRFIDHILTHHFDGASWLLRDVPGEDACNVGHGIEFVGFVLEHLGASIEPELALRLERILAASFEAGFKGPGIVLSLSVRSGKALNARCPWWSLPELIRAAALLHRITRSGKTLDIWKRADAAFFTRYWRGKPPVAYQMLTQDGPADVIPATPDLDPCYHTGLSFLAAARVAAEM
jgi:mannose/cellobiose epimerase-like protein (N-acyl-D-glucosamine 2-epimerase family)